MTRRLGDGTHEVSEFFVARRHRRHGIGQTARQLFHRHPGPWQLAFDHANQPATQFWSHVTATIAAGAIHRTERYPPEVAYPGTWLRLHVQAATK